MGFVSENLGTIIVAALLLAAVARIVFSLIRKKKSGSPSCGCGCGDCPMHGSCHKK